MAETVVVDMATETTTTAVVIETTITVAEETDINLWIPHSIYQTCGDTFQYLRTFVFIFSTSYQHFPKGVIPIYLPLSMLFPTLMVWRKAYCDCLTTSVVKYSHEGG